MAIGFVTIVSLVGSVFRVWTTFCRYSAASRIARILLPSKGSRTRSLRYLRLSRRLRSREEPHWHGSGRVRLSGSRLLPWLCAERFRDVGGASSNVVITVGQHRPRRRSDRSVCLGPVDRRSVWHRSRLRRYALFAGRSHGSDPSSRW